MRRGDFLLLRVARESCARFNADDGWAIASHIALVMLVALFPFLIILTSLASRLDLREGANEIVRLILESLPERAAMPLVTEINMVLGEQPEGLLTFSVLAAVWLSSSFIEGLRTGLNRAYGLRENRSVWLLRTQSLAFVLVGAMILLLVGFLMVFWPFFGETMLHHLPDKMRPGMMPLDPGIGFVRHAVAIALLFGLLMFSHRFLPARRMVWKSLLPGAILTLVLWVTAGNVYSLYLARFFADYAKTYAGLAGVMASLFFLYILALFFILGGNMNATIRDMRRKGGRE